MKCLWSEDRSVKGILSQLSLCKSLWFFCNKVMPERRWPLHNRQVELRRVWRSILLCCCGRHQDEKLAMEALIVVPVSEILILFASLTPITVISQLYVSLPVNAIKQTTHRVGGDISVLFSALKILHNYKQTGCGYVVVVIGL